MIFYYRIIRENLWDTLQAFVTGKHFLEKTPKAGAIKARIEEWDYIKLTIFCTPKETLKEATDRIGEKNCKPCTDKGLISSIHKESQPQICQEMSKGLAEFLII